MSPKVASPGSAQSISRGTLLNLPAELLVAIVANLDRSALWSLLVTCRALKEHAERQLYETFYLRRCIRSKAVVFRAVERIIDNPDLAVRIRRLDLRSTWSTINIMFLKLAPRLRAALQATTMLETLALPYDFPSTCYVRTLPGIVLPRLQHLNMHHVCFIGYLLKFKECTMLHDNVPWIRKHIGPLTHIELRCADLDSRMRSFHEQADLILDTTDSQLPVVPAQYFRSTASVLERLLAHTIAGTPGRKKLARGGTVHVRSQSVIVPGDPAVTPGLLDALSASDHMIGTLVLDSNAAFQAVYDVLERCDRTWEFKSLRHLRISSPEDDVVKESFEHLTSMLRSLFERIAMPALETIEVVTRCDVPPSGDVAFFLCGILEDCPSLVAIKVDDETLVRAAATAPWAPGTWPPSQCQSQCHWPFAAPPGFEERPRLYDDRSKEAIRCFKAAADRQEFLYDADCAFAVTDFNTYAAGDADFGRPDYPGYCYAATDPGDVEVELLCARSEDGGGSGEDERADEDENDDENEDEEDDDRDDDDDDGWNDGWSGSDENTDDVEDNGYESAGEKNLGDALFEKPRETKSQGANAWETQDTGED